MHNESNHRAEDGIATKPSLIQRLKFGGLLPIMIVQGLWVQLTVPKLAEAKGPRKGIAGNGKPLRILVACDSSAAGVGASTQTEALVGQLMSPLTDEFKVHWKLVAITGWRTSELRQALNAIPSSRYDIALTASGVNDITSRHSLLTLYDLTA
jgi:hypothetical protein